jgi:hypothetical protein
MARAQQESIPDSVFGALQSLQAGLAQTNQNVSDLTAELAKLTATWKDKAVTQIGAIALAAMSIIGAQRALAPTPPAPRVEIQQSELQIRADGCAKMANGSDEVYAQCMVREVVMPNTPGARNIR